MHIYTFIQSYTYIKHSFIHSFEWSTFWFTILKIKVCNITKVIPLKRVYVYIIRFCISNIYAYSFSLPQSMHYFLSKIFAHTTLPNTNILLEVFTTIGTPNLGYSNKIELLIYTSWNLYWRTCKKNRQNSYLRVINNICSAISEKRKGSNK